MEDGIMWIEIQTCEGGWYTEAAMWLRTIEDTNMEEVRKLMEIGEVSNTHQGEGKDPASCNPSRRPQTIKGGKQKMKKEMIMELKR